MYRVLRLYFVVGKYPSFVHYMATERARKLFFWAN